MSKSRIKRQASETRSLRRSLVELTAAATLAVDEGLLETSHSLIAAPSDEASRSKQAAITSDHAAVARSAKTAVSIALPESVDAIASRSDELDSDSTAEMFVKIAKDHQNRIFESVKVNLNAALDHAKDFVEPRHGGASPDNFLTALNGAAAQFGAALELVNANVVTALEYARDLSGTTTAAQFVELSSAQARKQCELILKQANVLRSLAATTTKSNAE
jgi:hypothetical protein